MTAPPQPEEPEVTPDDERRANTAFQDGTIKAYTNLLEATLEPEAE